MTSYITEEDKIEARTNNPVRFGPIGEKVFSRTYSRKKRDGTSEDWVDTCARVVNGNCNYVGPQYIEKGEAKKLFELFVGMQAIPAGRHLWATNIGNNTGFLNNCLRGNTILQTTEGPVAIKDLVGKTVGVFTFESLTKPTHCQGHFEGKRVVYGQVNSYGDQELYQVRLADGQIFYATAEHLWLVPQRKQRVPTTKLEGLDLPYILGRPNVDTQSQMYQRGVCYGYAFGDGTKLQGDCSCVYVYGQARQSIVPFYETCSNLVLKSSPGRRGAEKVGTVSIVEHDDYTRVGRLNGDIKKLPSGNEPIDYLSGWFRGLIAADGCCSKTGSTVLCNKSKEVLEVVAEIATKLGIVPLPIRLGRSHNPYDRENPKSLWVLGFLKNSLEEADFILEHHRENFLSRKPTKYRSTRVVSVTKTDLVEEVFCLDVPDGHAFAIGNWVLTSNCFSADFTSNFSEHFHFTFMRLMEGGGVGSNYSDRFINSREGTPSEEGKPWKAAGKKRLHLTCSPAHKDFNRAVPLDLYEESFFPNHYWMDHDTINLYERLWEELRQGPRDGEKSRVITYFKNSMTGEPDEDRPTRPYVDFRDLLSREYSYEWSPGVSNGGGPINIVVEDSREGWAACLRTVLDSFIHDPVERDVVVDVSRVRAYGEELKGFGGKASGPEALMLMLHRVFRLMNQRVSAPLSSLDIMLLDHYIAMAVISGGTRRSARMSMKYWRDSQILDFIKCKHVEPGKIPSHWTTNISVVIDNRFLRALKKNDAHAVKVYEAVVEAMLTNGEPGFINASLCCEGEAPEVTFFSTNPSLHGDTRVLTLEGAIPISELAQDKGYAEVLTMDGDWARAFFRKTGDNEPLKKIRFTSGLEALCTEQHKWPTRRPGSKTFKKRTPLEIKPGYHILLPTTPQPLDNVHCPLLKEDGFVLGWFMGDGWLCKHTTQNRDQVGFVFSQEDVKSGIAQRVLDYCNTIAKRPSTLRQDHGSKCWTFQTTDTKVVERFKTLGASYDKSKLPEQVWRGSAEFVEGFIDGLFSSDGYVKSSAKNASQVFIQLTSSREGLIKDVQKLLTLFGISSFVNSQKQGLKGRDKVHTRYNLISHGLHARRFAETFTLSSKTKAEGMTRILGETVPENLSYRFKNDRNYLVVESITDSEETADVYDGTVLDGNSTFATEAGYTGNCGEITMVRYADMYCFDVCCLAHVNLARVQHPEEAFRLMARFLLRATFAPVVDENQKKNVERNRRIGVGFFGYHNWLAKNGIKYSDAPNNEEVRKFFRRMKKVVDETSAQYAHDLRIPAPVKRTTIAPTGSISTLPGDCSAAQCNFAKALIRRVRYSNTDPELAKKRAEGYNIEPDMYAANTSVVSFVQIDPIYDEVKFLKEKELIAQGKSRKEAHELASAWANEIIEDQTELAIEEVLATQKMLQKEYVDNSISFTINVNPSLQAPDFVKNTLRHYLPDLKGVTIFPEWSMPQSPLERISFEEFKSFEERGYPIERSQVEIACASGVCPVK